MVINKSEKYMVLFCTVAAITAYTEHYYLSGFALGFVIGFLFGLDRLYKVATGNSMNDATMDDVIEEIL